TYSLYTDHVWTGLEPINSSAALTDKNNWGYYYRNGTVVVPAYQQPWKAGNPSGSNRGFFTPNGVGVATSPETSSCFYICEYEEELKQPVTDLEQKCFNLMSGSVLTSFVSDVCYVLNTVTKNYNDAKVSCNALSGYYGHLAHIRTMEELWIADALRSASGAAYAWVGIERVDLSSTNASIGWYTTTPTDLPMLATYLPWAASNPMAGNNTVVVKAGYPKSFATFSSNTLNPFLCQYDNTTATARRALSNFYHYSFGYFTNSYYWLSRSTLPLHMCIYMCHLNNLCYGFSYHSGTNDCQLLAIVANSLPYSSQLTADNQYETAIRDLQ
uniref:C-type lectin domain-containing protein n=1 Tax=Plectus sambesii TaxID=2011161 RepID=A0A914XJN6_9BILA